MPSRRLCGNARSRAEVVAAETAQKGISGAESLPNRLRSVVDRCQTATRQMMSSFAEAKRLVRAGRYGDALQSIGVKAGASERTDAAALRAEILERVGDITAARTLAERLLTSRGLAGGDASACHFVIARAQLMERRFDAAAASLQKAVAVGEAAGDLERAFSARL